MALRAGNPEMTIGDMMPQMTHALSTPFDSEGGSHP